MGLQIGPFPSQVNVGAVHFDTVGKGWWRFLGGNPFDPLSWLLIGGTVADHPDTTNWGVKQTGASWVLASDGVTYGWDGDRIVVIGGKLGEGSVDIFSWVPGAVSRGGIFGTWQDLYAAYRESTAFEKIIKIGNSSLTYEVPPGVYVFDGQTKFVGNELDVAGISLLDGAKFVDAARFEFVTLVGNSTSTPPCTYSSLLSISLIGASAVSLSAVPVFDIAVDGFTIELSNNGSLFGNALKLGPNVGCFISLLDQTCAIDGAQVGDVTSTLNITRYNEDCVVNISGFAGMIVISFPGNAQRVGTTAQRPTNSVPDGHMFFDTTLGKPVWKKNAAATKWVDATGAAV